MIFLLMLAFFFTPVVPYSARICGNYVVPRRDVARTAQAIALDGCVDLRAVQVPTGEYLVYGTRVEILEPEYSPNQTPIEEFPLEQGKP
jgi:hypothetical protein